MTCLHLVGDATRDVFKRKVARFLGHSRVEDDLKQQIAEFAPQLVHVGPFDGVGDLVSLFDGIRRYRREGLRPIPLTAGLRVAQSRHDP